MAGIPKAILRNGYVLHMHSPHCEYPVGGYEIAGGFERRRSVWYHGTKNKELMQLQKRLIQSNI